MTTSMRHVWLLIFEEHMGEIISQLSISNNLSNSNNIILIIT
ncbi:hypothetical protein LINPERHAP1_LOCUS8438 [Linum perenne]